MDKLSLRHFAAMLLLLFQLTACHTETKPNPDLIHDPIQSDSDFSRNNLSERSLIDNKPLVKKELEAPEPSANLIPSTNTDQNGKTAYLTFDDGPSSNTEPILAILRRYSIHATFFVTGNGSLEGQRLYRLIHNEGHVIGNHTYSHNYASLYSSVPAFVKDTEGLSKLLEQNIGEKPTLLRYPGGSNNQISRHYGGTKIMTRIIDEMKREGYEYTDWNVSSTDAASPVQPKSDIIDAVLSGSKGKDKAIILMHDITAKTTTVAALPSVIEGLLSQGFHFDVLDNNKFLFKFRKP